MLLKWINVVGMIIEFAGLILVFISTGNLKLGAVHSFEMPRWAHYTAWTFLISGFLLQLFAALCPLISR